MKERRRTGRILKPLKSPRVFEGVLIIATVIMVFATLVVGVLSFWVSINRLQGVESQLDRTTQELEVMLEEIRDPIGDEDVARAEVFRRTVRIEETLNEILEILEEHHSVSSE